MTSCTCLLVRSCVRVRARAGVRIRIYFQVCALVHVKIRVYNAYNVCHEKQAAWPFYPSHAVVSPDYANFDCPVYLVHEQMKTSSSQTVHVLFIYFCTLFLFYLCLKIATVLHMFRFETINTSLI